MFIVLWCHAATLNIEEKDMSDDTHEKSSMKAFKRRFLKWNVLKSDFNNVCNASLEQNKENSFILL